MTSSPISISIPAEHLGVDHHVGVHGRSYLLGSASRAAAGRLPTTAARRAPWPASRLRRTGATFWYSSSASEDGAVRSRRRPLGEPDGTGGHLAIEERVQQALLVGDAASGVAEGVPELRAALDQAAQPEQVVLDGVALAGLVRGLDHRKAPRAAPARRRGHAAGCQRSAGRGAGEVDRGLRPPCRRRPADAAPRVPQRRRTRRSARGEVRARGRITAAMSNRSSPTSAASAPSSTRLVEGASQRRDCVSAEGSLASVGRPAGVVCRLQRLEVGEEALDHPVGGRRPRATRRRCDRPGS